MRTDRFLFIALALVWLSACRKDEPQRPDATPTVLGNNGGAYITNEGNFQWGNATVSYYDIASGTSTEDLFAPANGTALGDVCQSMRLFNGRGYVVLNNSGKVVVVDPSTFVATASINGFTSPRYLLPVSNGKAYVTDLYANGIAVVDLNANTVVGSIPCAGGTEELVLAFGKAFVANKDRDHLYVIDTATDQVVDSIAVSRGANSIVEDAHGELWVACTGGGATPPALYRINAQANSVLATFAFPDATDSPWRLDINSGNDTLYFLNGDVFRMPIAATTLPTVPFVAANGRNFYGIGIEPASGILYVSDAIDYVQRGIVFRYAPNGALVNSFLAGIIPGEFCFR